MTAASLSIYTFNPISISSHNTEYATIGNIVNTSTTSSGCGVHVTRLSVPHYYVYVLYIDATSFTYVQQST